MSGSPHQKFFQAGLFPSLLPCEGTLNHRFRVHTSWHVCAPSPARMKPQPFDSLLVLDDLVDSVLPFTFHDVDHHGIYVNRLEGSAEPWMGIECTLGEATMWILHLNEREARRFRIRIRLPNRPATPEPDYPLLGTQFLRDFQFELDYRAFTWATQPDPRSRVGFMACG